MSFNLLTKKSMRIVLISAPSLFIRYNMTGIFSLPPLGLAYIAACLRNNNLDVEIIDMPALNITVDGLRARLNKVKYDVYGLSCNIFTLKEGIAIARLIKTISPSAKIILGGLCSAFAPELIFQYAPEIDVIVKGEGELTTADICKRWRNKQPDLGDVAGIAYLKEGKVITTADAAYLDLDMLPQPARDLLPNKHYKMHPPFGIYPPLTIAETSRGCAYKCMFCPLPQPLREKSVSKVIAEIKCLINEFKIREIHFVDSNFTFNQNRIKLLCEAIIRERIRFYWSCKTRVDLVSLEFLKIMRKAGCYMISYGVESGCQKILDALDKNIRIADIENAFTLTRNAGMRTIAYVLLGADGENDTTVKDTIALVSRIKPDFCLYGQVWPEPDSVLVKSLIGRGILSEEDLFKYYVLRKDIFKENIFTGVAKADISKWLSRANRLFYFNPAYLARRLWGVKNFSDFYNLISGASFLMSQWANKKKKDAFS